MFGTSCQGCRCSESNVFLSTVLCELHVSVLKSTFLKWKHSPVFVNGLWKRVATYLFYGSAINDAKYNKSDLQNTINCLRSFVGHLICGYSQITLKLLALRYSLPWTRGCSFCPFLPEHVKWLSSAKVHSLFTHGLGQPLSPRTVVAAQGFYKLQFLSPHAHSPVDGSEFSPMIKNKQNSFPLMEKSKTCTKVEKTVQ